MAKKEDGDKELVLLFLRQEPARSAQINCRPYRFHLR